MSDYRLKISGNIYIHDVKKLAPNFLKKENYIVPYKFSTLLENRIKNKSATLHIRIWSIKMAKSVPQI